MSFNFLQNLKKYSKKIPTITRSKPPTKTNNASKNGRQKINNASAINK